MSDQLIFWSPGITLDQMEKQIILKAFQHFRGNKTATANSLGIVIRTLDNKLERYDQEKIEAEKFEKENQLKREEFLRRARGNPPNNIGIPYAPNEAISFLAQVPQQMAIMNDSNVPLMPEKKNHSSQKIDTKKK